METEVLSVLRTESLHDFNMNSKLKITVITVEHSQNKLYNL